MILSLIGPEPYLTKDSTDTELNHQKSLEEDEIISFIHHTRPANHLSEANGKATSNQNGNKFVTEVDIELMEKLDKQ